MSVLSKSEYIASINNLLPDNSTQQISPQDIRLSLIDLADSVSQCLVGLSINTTNFATPEVRTTKAGDLALSKLGLVGRSSEDNSAFGYYSLGGNYNGIKNTAIGSNALGCNLYGSHNTAVGFNAIAGNLIGSGNVGIGNHSLQLNKNGNFNIAIGHGAGYYIDQNDSYKLYIGSHSVDSDSLCDAVSGSGADPLLFGDLQSLKLGIGTKTLDNFGTLQVSGAITPVHNKIYNLGHGSKNWNSLYLSSGIAYPNSENLNISVLTPGNPESNQYTQQSVAMFNGNGKIGFGTSLPSGDQGLITVAGNIVPKEDSIYRLGHDNLKWDAVFNDVIVSGQFHCNDINITQVNLCAYDCKTLHLASSGLCGEDIIGDTFCGFLTDEQLDGAGLEVHSSGNDYKRDYKFIFESSDPSLVCLGGDSVYSRSSWFSNISLHLESGTHLRADRVLSNDSGDVSLVSQSGCYGLFIKPSQPSGSIVYFAPENYVNAGYNYKTDVNFIGDSGNNNSFITSYSLPSSGTVGQRLISRTSSSHRGFGYEYLDENLSSDRLSTHIYNGQGQILEATTLLRNTDTTTGLFGVTNIVHTGTPIIPATIFNVQASNIADIRFSTQSTVGKVKVQLLGNGNIKASGFQTTYNVLNDNQNSISNLSIVDFDLIRRSGITGIESGVMSFTKYGYVGIGCHHTNAIYHWIAQDPLTIRHNASNSGTIALKEQASPPSATLDFGKIYVKPDTTGGNSQSMFFMDDLGNEVKITSSILNSFDGLLYGDIRGNTYGGWYSPQNRPTVSAYQNTSLGYYSLNSISTGSNNISIGSGSLSKLTSGSNNLVIGNNSFSQTDTAIGNIVLGNYNLSTSISDPKNCIVIGTGIVNDGSINDYTLALGFGDSPLVFGSIHPTDFSKRDFNIKQGTLSVSSEGNNQIISLHTNSIGGKYQSYLDITQRQITDPSKFDGEFSLRFLNTYNSASTLMKFNHSNSGMINPTGYAIPISGRPYAELNGDFRLRGAIRFSDGTSIESAGDVTLIGGTGIGIRGGTVNIDLTGVQNVSQPIDSNTSYLPISTRLNNVDTVSRISLSALADQLQSGVATIGANCNSIFTNAENGIDKEKNKNTVFIGCDVAIGATGWKHSIMIGTQAGAGATTPNPGLNIDTASTFIGYYAGKDADNVDNCVFIGSQAGASAKDSDDSVFIGTSVGYRSRFSNSVGIGKFALSCSGTVQVGSKNIEIVAGLLDSERLLFGANNYSNKLNIQNCIAGDSSLRRISIGDSVITPDAPLSVRKDNTIPGHTNNTYVQTWYCNDVLVASVDCNGDYIRNGKFSQIIEGIMPTGISNPNSNASPVSGIMNIKNNTWNQIGTAYIVNRDTTLTIPTGAYVVAEMINGTYRPVWVSCT